MIRINSWFLAVLVGGSLLSAPANAQSREGSSSLTHVVSVTLAPRVKVKVSALSMTASRPVPAAVKVSAGQSATDGLSLTVNASQAWVLAIKASPSAERSSARLLWATGETGKFTALSAADSLLASGTAASAVDTTVVFRNASRPTDSTGNGSVVLTISAP